MRRSGFNSFLAPLLILTSLLAAAHRVSALERWFYVQQNLAVDQNITNLVALLQRAGNAGYTHMLLTDSKFCHLATMGSHYFTNVRIIKQNALTNNIEIVPALFPVGYANDLLFNNPNLIEGMPATNTLLVVSNNAATIQPDLPVSFPSGGFSNLSRWTWYDSGTVVGDNGAARVTNSAGQNARIVQTISVMPYRDYHVSVLIKATNFFATPAIEVLGNTSGQWLQFNHLGVQPTQGWATHHAVFNSLGNTSVSIYFGVWGGSSGSLWWDNPQIGEVAFLNLIRRPGAPLTVQIENGRMLTEGVDYAALTDPLMGALPWTGCYDIFHTPPVLYTTNLSNGTRLRACWTHAVTTDADKAAICLSEPATQALLLDQAQRLHAAFGARGYFMSHDEIRVMNQCPACRARQMDAGGLLAENLRACAAILRQVNPGGRIYVWSDMFDPNHNAVSSYYLVRGNLTNSWKGLDSDLIVVPWDYSTRSASLQFFAGLGNRQMIAGYYDSSLSQVTDWLNAARPYPGICGMMYTTWVPDYSNLEAFGQILASYVPPSLWWIPRLLATTAADGKPQLVLEGERGQRYVVLESPDLRTGSAGWITWTNLTAPDATLAFSPSPNRFYRAACQR